MITLTYPAVIMTPRGVAKLRRIIEEHPGDEPVHLHLFGDEPCKEFRLSLTVDGSPEFLLAAMGLLDSDRR